MFSAFVITPGLQPPPRLLSSASHRVSTGYCPDASKSDSTSLTRRRAYHFAIESDHWRCIPRPLGAADGSAVLWIRGVDLRIRDAVALSTACTEHSTVAPLYIFRGDEDAATIAALQSFRQNLRLLGGDLFLRHARGSYGDVLRTFATRISSRVVHTVRGVSEKERRTLQQADSILRARGITLKQHWDNFVRAPDSLPFALSKAPATADSFAQRFAKSKVSSPITSPESISCPVNTVDPGDFPTKSSRPCGEREAWIELDAYFRGRSLASPEPGVNTSYGRIEKFMQLGCISARNVHHQVQRRLKPTSLKYHCAQMELELRDFFRVRALASISKSRSSVASYA